jgi:hypothetical protein
MSYLQGPIPFYPHAAALDTNRPIPHIAVSAATRAAIIMDG